MAWPSSYSYLMPPTVQGVKLGDSVDAELQFARAAFGEKVKELSIAVARVDALTKQLEELKRGNTLNSYQVFTNAVPTNSSRLNHEYEKLRQQLLHKTNMVDKQTSDLALKQSLLDQKKQELRQIDERIIELQQRISKKKQLNQELTMQIESSNKPSVNVTSQFIGHNSPLRNSIGPGVPCSASMSIRRMPHSFPRSNIAAVEPMRRLTSNGQDKTAMNHYLDELNGSKESAHKFATLPHDAKVNSDSKSHIQQNNTPSSHWNSGDKPSQSSIELRIADISLQNEKDVPYENNNSQAHASNVDWQKAKRRPVVVDDDMERALSDPSGDLMASFSPNLSPTSTSQGETSESALSEAEGGKADKIDGSLMSKGKHVLEDDDDEGGPNNQPVPENNIQVIETNNECHVPKSKGSLKQLQSSESKKNSATNLTRRVSFDPLALLLDAALEGELELVKKTASQVPDPSDVKDEGITALHNAICAGHLPIVEYLVSIGCDVNAQDSDGWTPLHCAASCNNLEMVKFLVENGACVFATTFSDGETAAEKCEEDEAGFDNCSKYLYDVQDQMGYANSGLVYAVYDYDAQNEDELSFSDGDVIVVLRKGDNQELDWWWSLIGEQEGYVPRNLLGFYPRVQIRGRMAPKNS